MDGYVCRESKKVDVKQAKETLARARAALDKVIATVPKDILEKWVGHTIREAQGNALLCVL